MLVATGMSKPIGRSKSSAGPPPGDLHARSVTAAISRSGPTGSPTRESSRRASRSERKSVRSLYMPSVYQLSTTEGTEDTEEQPSVAEISSLDHIRDLCRQRERPAPFAAA